MKYLYFKLYQILKKVKTNDTPATNSMILLSLLQSVNILTLFYLFKHYLLENSSDKKIEIIIFPVLLCLIIYTINYFILYKRRDFIFKKHVNESSLGNIIGYSILFIYFIGSFLLAYFVGTKFNH